MLSPGRHLTHQITIYGKPDIYLTVSHETLPLYTLSEPKRLNKYHQLNVYQPGRLVYQTLTLCVTIYHGGWRLEDANKIMNAMKTQDEKPHRLIDVTSALFTIHK